MTAIAHSRVGAGEPLVLVHGLGLRRESWERVVPPLAARHEVVLVDLPGFGESPPLDGRAGPADLAEALARFFAAEGLGVPHVAGHSLGGWVALELARRGAARSVTAIAPAGFANPRETAFMRGSLLLTWHGLRALRPLVARLAGSAAGRTALGLQYFSRPWLVPPDLSRLLQAGFADAPGFQATLAEMVAAPFADGREIAVPVTIAWPARDLLLLPRQARRAQRALPGARLVELAGCGHVPFWDDPSAVARVVLDGATP